MAREQYISYKLAMLAKQAGFDWEVNTYYLEQNNEIEYKSDYKHHAQNYNCSMATMDSISFQFSCYSAPTQAVLQRWLREKYNVHITIEYTSKCQGSIDSYHVWYWRYSDKGIKVFGSYLDDGNKCIKFPTYEAALEAGLKHCLTLILEENKNEH